MYQKKVSKTECIFCSQKSYKKLSNCVMFKTETVLCPSGRECRRQLSLCTDLKALFHLFYFMMKQVYCVLILDKKNMDST